jgi:hypothetical protein
MPPKKAVKQPARQLTKTATPVRRRPAGAAGTLDLTEDQLGAAPAADELVEAGATRTLAPAAATPARPAAPARAVPPARPIPAARRTTTAASVAGSSLRTMRGRVAQQIQGMDLREEMAWIRSDIGRLTVLAVAGFVVLIVLAIVLPMFNL